MGTPSRRRAREALPEEGTVLDVGAGGGAASLPLVPPAARIVAVDQSADMLASFAAGADARGVDHEEIEGLWPDVAAEVEVADVVVCHHVVYNIADLVPFVRGLDAHAHRRVVLELTDGHPQSSWNALWREIHGVERPTSPKASDAVAVLEEMGLKVGTEAFERTNLPHGHEELSEMVPFVRRQLCVGPDRDAEIENFVRRHGRPALLRTVTVWWDVDGRAAADPYP